MKKLYTMLVAMVLVVMMGIPGFAGTLTLGNYRPFGLVAITDSNGKTSYTTINSYEHQINITYIDSNYIFATKDGEQMMFTCPDPINKPNFYCMYYNDNTTVLSAIKLPSSGSTDGLYYIINGVPAGDYEYFYSYKLIA